MTDFVVENNELIRYTGHEPEVVIPDGIEKIHSGAFQNNNKITMVTMPNSVGDIGSRAFSGCTRLKEIRLSKNLKTVQQHVFSGCTSLEAITVPGSLNSINMCMFLGCINLKDVHIENGVKNISVSAFNQCRSITELVIPKTVTRIKQYAFGKCAGLRKVTFLGEEKRIHNTSFYKCSSVMHFSWPEVSVHKAGFEDGFIISSDNTLKGYFGTAEKVVVPEGVESLWWSCFAKCYSVKELVISRSVKEISDHSLAWIPNVDTIILQNKPERIGEYAFWATQMESINLPASIKNVGADAFGQCHRLKEMIFESDRILFNGRIAPMAYGLRRVVMPSHQDVIPCCAFYYCEGLSEIVLPETISRIESHAFVGCKSLNYLSIPKGVDHICVDIVDGCSSLIELVLESHRTTYEGRTDEFCTASVRYADEPKVKNMVIFMGLQGSGKSHYYNWHFAGKYEHVNLDQLHTRNKEMLLLKQLIAEGKDFVVDNTNPQREDRARYIELGKSAGYHIVGYFFESKLKDCIRRNNQRDGKAKLPAKAIAATSNKLQIPSKEEGFDELYFIERSGEVAMLKRDWRD